MNWLKIEDLAMQYRDTLSMLKQKKVKMLKSAKGKKEPISSLQYLVLISEISEVSGKWFQLKKYCNARGLKLEKAGARIRKGRRTQKPL